MTLQGSHVSSLSCAVSGGERAPPLTKLVPVARALNHIVHAAPQCPASDLEPTRPTEPGGVMAFQAVFLQAFLPRDEAWLGLSGETERGEEEQIEMDV